MDRVLRELLEAVILAMIVFLIIHTSLRNFKVEGSSMNPTLESGQHLIVNRLVYSRLDMDRLSRIIPFWQTEAPGTRYAIHPPRRGEVIVFNFPRDPSKDFVKRVIGLPGEEVKISRGQVFINGEALPEPYLVQDRMTLLVPLVLGENEYFVLGDNRGSSNDSRMWGPVPEDYVVGKVWFVYWPFSEVRLVSAIPDPLPETPR